MARRSGLTIIELLVAVAICCVLAAVTVPAVQGARESARRVQCRNNLRQIGLAFATHEAALRRYPGNEWGYLWIGDPDSGPGDEQPGGWPFQILPELEQRNVQLAASGAAGAKKRQRLADMTESVVPELHCPSRGGGGLGPQYAHRFRNANWRSAVQKTDYAVNEGDQFQDSGEGPASSSAAELAKYGWIDRSAATGICFQRSAIRPGDILDGLSNTYLVGEKYVRTASYNAGGDPGHDQSAFSGADLDNKRWVIEPPLPDGEEIFSTRFGSPHTTGWHVALCDGAVRYVSFSIDLQTHRRLGNRRDRQPVELP